MEQPIRLETLDCKVRNSCTIIAFFYTFFSWNGQQVIQLFNAVLERSGRKSKQSSRRITSKHLSEI